ncbi:MAG: tetratricopeptide repeat protein [Bacteroidota bacterium]
MRRPVAPSAPCPRLPPRYRGGRRFRLLGIVGVAVALAVPVSAQTGPPRPPAPPVESMQPDRERSIRETLDLARRMTEAGRTRQAVNLLEDLYDENRASLPVWSRLLSAYEADRRFEDALALIDARIADLGASVHLLTQRGTALYKAGRLDDAAVAWDEAVAFAPDQEHTYRTVSNGISSLRLFGEAAAVLDAGRDRLGNEDLFRLELAHLYGLSGEYEQSARFYLEVLAVSPENVRTVQARLARLTESVGALDGFDVALREAVAEDPFNAAFREMEAWVALERGEYGRALSATRATDRLVDRDGFAVFNFAELALAAGALDEADQALDVILDRYANGPLVPPSLLRRARIAEERAREAGESAASDAPTPLYDRARDAYAQFADDHSGHPDATEALRRLADLYLDVYRAPDEAEEALDRLIASTFDPATVGKAKLDLGIVALQRGDLFEARDRFQSIEDRIRTGPQAEQARYEMAMIDFYEGFLFSALARAEAMDDNTAADVANDAVSLRLTLDENAGPDSTNRALRTYGRAALLHRRGLHTDALVTLDSLQADDPNHPLADEVLVLRAHVLRDLGRYDEALAALARVPEEHPRSYFLDRALFQTAEIHQTHLGDPAAALDAYGRLLDLYPGSLLAPRARERLRALRAQAGA